MTLVEVVLGNTKDDDWQQRLQDVELDWLNLDQWEAQKTRLRKRSDAGAEVAISLPRGVFLRDGDILLWDEAARQIVAAKITIRDVLVVKLAALMALDPTEMARTCVELGHAIGNQHWPAVVKGDRVFVPLTVDRKVMASVMKTHAFQGVEYEFLPGAEVIPYLAPHESRRLFGGAEGPVHSHVAMEEAPPEHSHPHESIYSHSHGRSNGY